jgi:hypothetical protein
MFKVLVRTKQDRPFALPNQGKALQIVLSAEQGGSRVEGTVSSGSTMGEYLVHYVPVAAGKHMLQVNLEDEPIAQSPFQVTVASGMLSI